MSAAQIYLRCDLAPEIGVGHFKRLQTLAMGLGNFKFILPAQHIDRALTMGVDKGDILPRTDPHYPPQTPGVWVITDINYAGNRDAAAAEIRALSAAGARVCVIDSMPPDHFAPHLAPGDIAPDLVITPYHGADHLRPPPPCKTWLFGGKYAVLDPIYDQYAGQTSPGAPGLLIACGGSDPTGLSLHCARDVSTFSGPITVVAGPLFHPDLVAQLESWAQGHANRSIALAPKTLAPLIASHALVIGRPGLIRYEAAALGKTSILLSETDGYVDYFNAFSDAGLAEIYFAHRPEGRTAFSTRLQSLADLAWDAALFAPNRAALKAVPMGGAARILAALT